MTTDRMATEKIAAALRDPEPEPDPLPEDLAALPVTLPQLTSALGFADQAAGRLERIVQSVRDIVERSRRETAERLAGMSSITPGQRDKLVAEETTKAHRRAMDESDKARYDALRELDAVTRRVDAAASLFGSPVTMLAREGLGLERRTHLQQQLEGAGPAELRNMALLAVAQGDLVLGAAVVTTLDRMPSSRRPVSARDIATRLVGRQHEEATQMIAAVRNRMQNSLNANRDLGRREAGGSLTKIQRALRRSAEGDVADRLADDGED